MKNHQQSRIPRCMSTQHPDNVNLPFFAENSRLSGEDEIQEAYYAFSYLSCDEQLWDCEGKEIDNFVIKKLLLKYPQFFKTRRLGRDVFITLRVPNPAIEKTEAKILLETLESIPRSFDAAKLFYGRNISPIFEVILPMTSSARQIDRIYKYYRDFVAGKQNKQLYPGDIKIGQWIGKFQPEQIKVIPLFEDLNHLLNSANIVKQYLSDKLIDYQRVFLARSDPAMNYGLISSVILNKIALQRLQKLSENTGIKIYPIVGLGSSPFRGNLKPETVERIIAEYPSVWTFTIQSAFKYDYPAEQVKLAIQKLKQKPVNPAHKVEEKKTLPILKKYSAEYQRQIKKLAKLINKIAKYIPERRKRKLHVGLFGYSRNIRGIQLPRAISFTASLYSIGLPPEILGLNALTKSEIEFVSQIYLNLKSDLTDALTYFNPNCKFLPRNLSQKIRKLFNFQLNKQHRQITNRIQELLIKGKTENFKHYILAAANLRKFLG